jgi:hypothetical protein
MIEEGSVLAAGELRGRAVDVAPDGFTHPVYRSGFALAVRVPVGQALPPVQTPEAAAPVVVEEPAAHAATETPEAVVPPALEEPAESAEEPAALAPEEAAMVPLADARGSETQTTEEPDEVEG